MFLLSYLPHCSILKLSLCNFFFFWLTHINPPFLLSLPHFSLLSPYALLSQLFYSFCFFPSLFLPHPIPVSPYLFASINVSTFLYFPFPIFLSLVNFSLNLFFLPSLTSFNPSVISLFYLYPTQSLLISLFSPFPYQGKGISKSVSMNCGPCLGMALGVKTLSHSDSYTWAMENQRHNTARSLHRDGSVSSLGSQDLSFSDMYLDNCIHTESQVQYVKCSS